MFEGYSEVAFQVVVGACVLIGLWLALRPRYVFTLVIEGARLKSVRGTVPSAFVQEVEGLCEGAELDRGKIHGVARGRHIQLSFSQNIPDDCRQKLRNLWQLRTVRP